MKSHPVAQEERAHRRKEQIFSGISGKVGTLRENKVFFVGFMIEWSMARESICI